MKKCCYNEELGKNTEAASPVDLLVSLLPCPFCGAKPIGPEHADESWWTECPTCEYVMENTSKSHLIRTWNTRFKG